MYYVIEKKTTFLISAADDFDALNRASCDEGVITEQQIEIISHSKEDE